MAKTSPMSQRAHYLSSQSTPCPERFNLASYIFARAAPSPDKVILECIASAGHIAQSWTSTQLQSAILSTATGLLKHGIKKGDIIALRLGNTPEFPIAFLAAITIGALPVPTSAALTPGEFARILADLGDVRAIVLGAELDAPNPSPPIIDQNILIEMRHEPAATPSDTHKDDPAYIVYTSGSSGTPKGVVHAHRAVWARRMMWRDWYDLRENDRLLHAGAFNWTYTLGTGLLDPWAMNATALIYTGPPERGIWPALIETHNASIFAAAPGIFRQSLDTARPLPSLRHSLSAGEHLPADIARRWQAKTGTPIYSALGMSECSTYISSNPSCPAPKPQRGRTIAILDENASPTELGKTGDLAIHNSDPGLMLGYHRKDAAPHLPLKNDWFVTGDLAQMDVQNRISHKGRADDLMTAGGYRIAPQEIEATLNAHPDITNCAVTSLTTSQGATIIAAFYEAHLPIEQTALHTYIEDRLARHKQPRAYIHLPELPKMANGKLNRKALRAWNPPN